MINKISPSIAAALEGTPDGATVLIGGFGTAGIPSELIDGLIEQGARDLTIVNNNAGNGETGLAALLKANRVRKIVCSFPRQVDSHVFDGLYRSGKLELELVPQGNLAERLRAAGAGIGGFFTCTGYGTELAKKADGSLKETLEEEISEMQQLVIATASMPREDWARTRAFSWITAFLHFDKVLQIPIVLSRELCGIGYREIFEAFLSDKTMRYPVLNDIKLFFFDKARDIQNGGAEYCHAAEWLDIFH